MTFTYTSDFTTALDEIRFTIGDTVENTGVKPNGTNFSNEEIEGLLGIEVSTGRTIARLYETLASLYATEVDTKIGSRDEKSSQKAANYLLLAKRYRDEYGGGSGVTISIGSFDENISEDDPDD